MLADGNLLAMAEEERFNRIEFSPRMFPYHSMDYCLKKGSISINEVDCVAVGFDHVYNTVVRNLRGQPFYYGILSAGYMLVFNSFNLLKIPPEIRQKKPIFINHHVSHANSAFYCSSFEDANIISIDGTGGDNAGLLGYARGVNLEIFKTISNSDSWGRMYSQLTKLLGFKPHQDEYKVMGLAAYGTPDPKGLPFVDWNRSIPIINRTKYRIYRRWLKRKIDTKNPMNKMSQNIAATTQMTLERVVLTMLEWLQEKTGCRNLCVCGGTAQNVVMNSKLLQSGFIDNLFVQPSSWDGGAALGAAIQVHIDKTGNKPNIGFSHAYWGPIYGEKEIEEAIKNNGIIKYLKSDNILVDIAKQLVQNKVVGWFQGRLEIGPRALGNRSILGNPQNPEMKDLINVKIKGREPWRPFAPSIQEEHAHKYLERYYPSPYMLLSFDVKVDKLNEIVSATHVDGTCRPQTVTKDSNPVYWNLIEEFRKMTGVPAVLNTSFNLSDEPIVCNPEDAIKTFYRCGMDILVLGNIIIEKTPDDYKGPPILKK